MAFIPNPNRFNPGDRVRLTVDYWVPEGTYTRGHEFVVKSQDYRDSMDGLTKLEDSAGRSIYLRTTHLGTYVRK